MKKLLKALITLTAIGVAVKVMKDMDAIAYSSQTKDRFVKIISNKESASVLIQDSEGIQSYVLPRN